jgi:tetratricopeptide (TPR) repeat protein
VASLFSEIREQYLRTPELAIPHIANRIEEQNTIIHAGFGSLQSGLRELRDTAADALDLQIDEAKDRLERHEYEVAREALKKLRQAKWGQMSARQRFRVLSNLAMIDLQQGKLNGAANLFIEAKDLQPEDQAAVANEALAYLLMHDNGRAYELADRAKARFPTSARALMVWLNTAPVTASLKELEDSIPPFLAADPEVLVALGHRALMAKDAPKAEEITRRAVAVKEDWSYSRAQLGEIIFRSQLPDNAEDYADALPVRDKPRLTEAADTCTKAIELAKKEKHLGIEAAALLVRAEARRRLGDASADEDIIAAYNIQPDDPTILSGYACMKIRLGQNLDAIEKLRLGAKHHARADLRMLLAFALSATREPGDRTEAIRIFSSLAADPGSPSSEFRTQAAIAAIGNLVDGQRWDEARALLSQLPPSSISTTALAALRGRVDLSAGERQAASEFATQANASIAATASHEDIRLTARFLADLGRHRDALPLWQRLASPTSLGHDSCRLIDSTLRLGEHRLLLEFCEQLRLNGFYDAQLIGLDAGIRELYDIEGTIGLLQEYLSRVPDDRNVRLQLSVIGIQRGRPELVSSDPASMPRPEDTPPENWMAIVLVMKSGGHLWEALKLGYRILRLNFGKIEAHRAYFASLLPTDPLPDIPTPDVAGPGTAVAFAQEGSTQIDWFIIEEEYEPDLNLQEIGLAHLAAQQLAGKRVGDTFVLAEGSVVPQRATILQIVSKYAYRHADCGQNWMKRFPDHPYVQPVRTARRGVST